MFSQNSSIEDGYNFPDTSKDLNYSSNKNFPKFKRRNKQAAQSYQDQDGQKPQTPTGNKLYFKIQVIKKVGRFLQNLKAGVVLQKPNLKPTQLLYLQSQTKQNQKQTLIPYQNIGVILLQTLVVIILWINMWQSSYQIIFSQLLQIPIIEIITVIVYAMYVYFFLNTEFKNQKLQLISNRQVILEYYINQRLLFDALFLGKLLLQITPLDDYVPLFVIFRASSIFVLKPLSDLSKKLQNIISISTDAQIILSIMGLFFKIFLLLHSLSLLFTSLSKIQKRVGIDITWVQKNQLNITSQIQQYMVGWYWGATILSTVGFGDITPANHVQRFFCSFIQVMCCMIFGFFVNYIGSLINMVGQSKKIYQKDMRKLNRYLLKQNLPDQLKSNIRSHFFNKNKIQQVYDPSSQQTIMNKLTTHLTNQITQTRNKQILLTSKFIKPFTQQTIRKLSLVAKKMVFAPQQIIFSQKSKDMKLWILEDGIVEQIPTSFNPKQDKPITIYQKNHQKTIGWINLLTDKPYKTMARAKTFTLSYQIKQEDFYRILRESQIDYNKMHELKQTLIQNKREYINKCLSCQRYTHNVIQCPRIHFKSRGIFKILIQQKKQQMRYICKKRQRKQITKKTYNRSRLYFNWKSFESFSQITPQIESIVAKYNQKSQFDDQFFRRCSVQSFVHILYRNKSSQHDKNLQKRSSQNIQSNYIYNRQSNPIYNRQSNNLYKRQSHNQYRESNNLYKQTYTTNRQLKNNKIQPSEVVLELKQPLSDKQQIINYIDKVYLGQANGYFENHNFFQISKKYMLYILNLCTNRNKI